MGLEVSTKMELANKELMRNTAETVSARGGVSRSIANQNTQIEAFDSTFCYTNPQLAIIKASIQISANTTLEKTLQKLKASFRAQIRRKPKFGELWSILETANKESEKNPYNENIYNFILDENTKNIFAA